MKIKLIIFSFKPCYKWITFNTPYKTIGMRTVMIVLNLVINGLPSIHLELQTSSNKVACFKPCYKWITFNTSIDVLANGWFSDYDSFKPCYKWITFNTELGILMGEMISQVLNLVINGLPSIL